MNELLKEIDSALALSQAGATLKPGDALTLLTKVKAHLAADKTARITAAMKVMSVSELEGLVGLAKALPSEDGIVVTSRVADQIGISRSVLTGTLRIMEAACVVRTDSMGQSGTRIRTIVPGWAAFAIKQVGA